MKILVVETSSESGLLACVQDGLILYKQHLPHGSELSKTLGVEIKKLLDEFPLPYERIVLGVGPGSFTGTRVGAAMANALAYGWNIPLHTVSSLIAFGPGIVIVDAALKGLYIQESYAPPKLLTHSEAEKFLACQNDLISPHPEKILLRIPGRFRKCCFFQLT